MTTGLRVQILLYLVLQAAAWLLFMAADWQGVAFALSRVLFCLVSGVLLASICHGLSVSFGARQGKPDRVGRMEVGFALLGWLVVVLGLLVLDAGDAQGLFTGGQVQGFWRNLLQMVLMQAVPFSTIMSCMAFLRAASRLFAFLFRPLDKKAAQKSAFAQDAETHEADRKILLVASARGFIPYVVVAGLCIALAILLGLDRYLPAPWIIAIICLVWVFLLYKAAFHVYELALADGCLRIKKGGAAEAAFEMPFREAECYGVSPFRPKGFGFMLRIQGREGHKRLWLVSDYPQHVTGGYRGFTQSKLEKDVADISACLEKEGVPRREFPQDAFVCRLPPIILAGIVAAGILVLGLALWAAYSG